MSVSASEMALNGEIDRFWQGVDQRTETPQGIDEAHTDTPMFVWGVLGTPLVLPQPSYRFFVPAPYYVVAWGLVADAVGHAVVKVEHAGYNPGGSVGFVSVTGGADPTLSGQQVVVTKRLTTWSPNKWGIFDLIHIYIDSTTGLQELSFQLFTRRIPRVGVTGRVTASGGSEIITTSGVPVVLASPQGV